MRIKRITIEVEVPMRTMPSEELHKLVEDYLNKKGIIHQTQSWYEESTNTTIGNRQCVIDGEDDTKPDIPLTEKQAMDRVNRGTLIECTGCSTDSTRAFHTKRSYPELFEKGAKAHDVGKQRNKKVR